MTTCVAVMQLPFKLHVTTLSMCEIPVFYLFISGLFDDAVSSLDHVACIALNDTMISE